VLNSQRRFLSNEKAVNQASGNLFDISLFQINKKKNI